MNLRLLFLGMTILLSPLFSSAQYSCSGGRYHDEIFSNVTVTSNVVFGSAKSYTGATTTLKMDIYQPTGDTATKRPMIIWAHGGSFVGGTKTDADVVALATRFAKRGYVCASYEYRLGMFPIDQANASRAVYRATQDAKAAVRFFRKDAATTNTYKVDAGYINLGGSSAGAFIALHYAYLDQASEIPSYLDTTGLGDIEGNSGNPGHCSEISSVINLCGALGQVGWMHAGDEPVCSMHGTADATVPYATDTIVVLSFPVMLVDGSHTVDSMATVIGLDHVFHTWIGADHVPYATNTTYMDSTVEFVRDFLCNQISKPAICPVTPSGVSNSAAFTTNLMAIYPRVSSSEMKIENHSGETITMEMLDISGRRLKKQDISGLEFVLQKESLSPGMYFLSFTGKGFRQVEKIIFN